MSDIWTGNVILSEGTVIEEISLTSEDVASAPTLPPSPFRFLSTVDTSKIPLHLAVSPSLQVWTTSEQTESWFESILLSSCGALADSQGNQWWHFARSQAPIGILVEVPYSSEECSKSRITEILFYGTIAMPQTATLPTPPSSSPQVKDVLAETMPEFRVHALPLSSDLLYQPTEEIEPGLDPQFVQPLQVSSHMPPTVPKRKRDIFEEATIANRKARGRGGQSVAAAAAVAARSNEGYQAYTHRKSLSIDTKLPSLPDIRPTSANGSLPRSLVRPPSRSPSISSDIRPLSQKGQPESQGKRSNLSRVATLPQQSEESTTETRNKEALSKVVMAAMRMHGLQQRKKPRNTHNAGVDDCPTLTDGTAIEDASKDDEYKLIYHQTYKSASLALRKYMLDKPLHAQPDRLRDVVEKLLTIFLTDPLTQPLQSDHQVNMLATPGNKSKGLAPGSTHSRASPFDLPSSAARPAIAVSRGDINTGSPMSRRYAGAT